MFTLSAFVEGGHWFISASYLDLHEVGPLIATFPAICVSLIDIFPCFFSAKDIISVLSFQRHLFLEGLSHSEDVGTSLAEESEVILVCFLGEQEIRTGWAKQHCFLVRLL